MTVDVPGDIHRPIIPLCRRGEDNRENVERAR